MRSIPGTITEYPRTPRSPETFRLNTVSGLHGRLVEWHEETYDEDTGSTSGWAIVVRDNAPQEDRPYSVHHIHFGPDGKVHAQAGVYDLSLSRARARLVEVLS